MGKRRGSLEGMAVNAFKNRRAVITGASSGIGRAIALELAREGAALCLIGRSLSALESVAEQARRNSVTYNESPTIDVTCFVADLSRDEDISHLVSNLITGFRIDILIHSAGANSQGLVEASPVDDLDYQYRINVRAPYVLTQALLPSLRASQGEIVFLNSTMGRTTKGGAGQYAATKHALKAFAEALRDEVNPQGIRILDIFLGRTASPMQAAIHETEGRTYRPDRLIQPSDVASVILSALSLPRSAEVTEISMRPFIKP